MVGTPMEKVTVPCSVCRSTSSSPFYKENDWDIVRCDLCGFAFVNPRPAESWLVNLYSDPVTNTFVDPTYEPKHFERPTLEKIIRFLKPRLQTGRLLEIGCGRGDFLEIASLAGYQAEGCDIFGETLPQVSGVRFHQGPLLEAGLAPDSYDCIVTRNTLEHVFDPEVELAEIHRLLKPGGILYVKVPNLRYTYGLLSRLMVGRTSAFDAPYHLSHFDERTLVRMLDRMGFDLEAWFVEQPSLRKGKKNFLRQLAYRFTRVIHILTRGALFPKIGVLTLLSRKRTLKA